jgi:hypothetical protein
VLDIRLHSNTIDIRHISYRFVKTVLEIALFYERFGPEIPFPYHYQFDGTDNLKSSQICAKDPKI